MEANDKVESNKNNLFQKLSIKKLFKTNKLFVKIIIVTIFLIATFVLIFLLIAAINKMNSKVYNNIFVLDKNLSNCNANQVLEKLEETEKYLNESFEVSIYQDQTNLYNLNLEEIDFKINKEKTISDIFGVGRDKNFILDNIDIISANFYKHNVNISYEYDKEKLNAIIKQIDTSISNKKIDDYYTIDNDKKVIILNRGKSGYVLDYDEISKDLIEVISGFKSSEYLLTNKYQISTPLDVDNVYKQITKKPKDAYIDLSKSPPTFISEENGYEVNLELLKSSFEEFYLKTELDRIEIPIEIVNAKIKLSDLKYDLYNDKLAGFTTYFNSTQKARSTNLEVALNILNGAIVMPGEVFSYSDRLGEIDAAKGYLPAATFQGGIIVDDIGGGVCQTSSTLYNAALLANLDIIERHEHGLPVGYVAPSRDATIYTGILDLKIKNTRNYPVKIVTSFSSSGNLNISIYGTKEKIEYDISIESNVISYLPYSTSYIYDETLETGKTSIITNGVNGYTSEAYIIKKLNGSLISNTLLSRDTYSAQKEVVKIGSKNSQVNIY